MPSRAALSNGSPHRVKLGQAQLDERLLPDVEAVRALLEEGELPLVVAQRGELAAVGPVEELLAWCFGGLALEEGHEVVAVEVDLVGLAADLLAGRELGDDV